MKSNPNPKQTGLKDRTPIPCEHAPYDLKGKKYCHQCGTKL